MSAKKITQTAPVGVIAHICNITNVRVQQLAKLGIIIKSGRGTYELWSSVTGYIKYLQDRNKTGVDGEPGEYEAHRTRLYKARADIAETQAMAIREELHDGGCIAEVMGEGLANLRAKMLAIPTTAGPRVADEADPAQCAAILEGLINEALIECSRYNGKEVTNRYLKKHGKTEQPEEEGWET